MFIPVQGRKRIKRPATISDIDSFIYNGAIAKRNAARVALEGGK